MESRFYILKGKKPVPASLLEWADWFKENTEKGLDSDRVVHFTKLNEKLNAVNKKEDLSIKIEDSNIHVSTVFIGIQDQLFETMVYCDDSEHKYNGYIERYDTYEEAEKGHVRICKMITK